MELVEKATKGIINVGTGYKGVKVIDASPELKAKIDAKKIRVSEAKIYETYNYELFSLIQGNRDIIPPHIEQLKESMKEEYLMKPADVNQAYGLIDGQHRFFAAWELGLPFYFIVHNHWGLSQVMRLNNMQMNWGLTAYLHSYVQQGYEDYIIFEDFQKKWKFSTEICMSLLMNKTFAPRKEGRDFKAGRFRIENFEWAEEMAQKIKDVTKLYKVKDNRRNLIFALLYIFQKEDYVHSYFMEKVLIHGGDLRHHALLYDYVREFEYIYNSGKKLENRVRWI